MEQTNLSSTLGKPEEGYTPKQPEHKAPFGPLGLFTFLRTYARRHNNSDPNSTVESFDETIKRVVMASNSQLKVGFNNAELDELFHFLYNLKCSVAGRFLWQLGTKTVEKAGLMSLQNCCFTIIDSPVEPFVWTMNFLMLGAGVGYKIMPENVDKIPQVKYAEIIRNDVKDADFIIPDSREGWIKLLGKVLKAHFYSGKGFTYSCMLLRSKGAPIKGFGGVASGPDALCEGIEKINGVLNSRTGMKLRCIDALDIMNLIGRIVVSGNVRRCKPENSLVFTRKGLIRIQEIKTGQEVLTSKGYSKVVENISQGIQKLQYVETHLGTMKCTPGHRVAVLTSQNDYIWKKAKDLADKDYLVYINEDIEGVKTCLPECKETKSFVAVPKLNTDIAWYFGYFQGNGCVYRRKNNNGGSSVSITVQTKYEHIRERVISLMERFGANPSSYFQGTCVQVTANSKQMMLYFSQFKESHQVLIVPDFILEGTKDLRAAYLAGLYDADGRSDDGCLRILTTSPYPTFLEQIQSLYASIGIPSRHKLIRQRKKDHYRDSYELHVVGRFSKNRYKELVGIYSMKYLPYEYKKNVRSAEDYHYPDGLSVDEYFDKNKEYPNFIPIKVFKSYLSEEEVPTYDLSVANNHQYVCSEGILNHNSAQIALGDVNDKEYMKAKRWDLGDIPNWRAYSNNSVICNDITEVLENKEFWEGYNGNGEPYGLINLRLSKSCGRLGETQYPDPDCEGVNPCAEQTLCRGESCCLAELFLPNINSKKELFTCVKYLYRICKHSLTLPCPESKATEEIVHKNMRMGIGVTGYLQATDEQRSWLSPCYKYLREFDKSYSQMHNFPPSIKLTTVKPAGTLSLLAGVTSGVHPGYAQYYIRRIRIASESSLINLARKHGYHIEFVKNFDGTNDLTTMVISFPYKLPDGTVLAKDCTAIEQMEWVKKLQTEWSDNSVSVTVYYRKNELPEIKEWLRKNYNNSVKTISFLLHNEHGFKQAPMEEITKEEYEKLNEQCKPIDSVEGVCYHAEDEKFIGEGECRGNACPMR